MTFLPYYPSSYDDNTPRQYLKKGSSLSANSPPPYRGYTPQAYNASATVLHLVASYTSLTEDVLYTIHHPSFQR